MKTILAYLKLTVAVILIAMVLIFTTQNADAVLVRLLGWSFESSLSLLIFLVLAIGVLSGFLLTEWFHWRGRKRGGKGEMAAPKHSSR